MDQHLIFLNSYGVSINNIRVTEFIIAKKISTQWNQRLRTYVFSKVTESFEKSNTQISTNWYGTTKLANFER